MVIIMIFWVEGMFEEDRGGMQVFYVDRDFVFIYGIEMQFGCLFDNDWFIDLLFGYLINEVVVV